MTGADEDIVVTGTSIRGVAPVGSNLMAVARQEIDQTSAQTVQQILRTAPAITGSGSTPQGGNAGNSFYAPTIHGLGSSSSNSTLVLVDGHRISPGSQQQQLTDPNIIPPIALERVEVLAEGASSTYGSDAVAGVVNFITRRNYDGAMATGQLGFGDGYRTYNAGLLWGTKWDTGSVMLAYNYSRRSALAFSDRDYLNRDHTAQGGTNFGSFFCSPAAIQPQGVSTIYLSPTSTTSIANTAANSPCQKVSTGDIFPREIRNNAMLKIRQGVGENLTVSLDAVYSRVTNKQNVPRGTLTATVFRTGAQANPFYVNPPGVLAGTAAGDRQQVRWDADELLGPGAYSFNNAVDYYADATFEYKIGSNFRITGLGLYGREDSYVGDQGRLCVSCANLALNGTTNAGGSLTQPSIPGTTTIVTSLPLTAANALDVWNGLAGNRTAAAVLARLTDNSTQSRWYYSIRQFRLGTDGTLFDLPGGAVKIAAGVEYVHYGLDINRTRPNNTGPSTSGSEFFKLNLSRNVKSFYGELLVPIIGPSNALPFVQSLDLSLSGRYDRYSGIGSTKNPHVALAWGVVDGLKLRGNYSRSFVAPQLTSVGDRSQGGLTSFSGYGASNTTLIVPISSFPLAAQIPGVTCTATTCTVGASVNGISLNGGPADPRPGKGISWSLGVDFLPRFLPGFRTSVTLFNNKLINQISGTSVSNAINSAALNSNLQFFPNGATQADITAVAGSFPQTSVIPSPIYYIVSVRQQNILNLNIQGLDASANYDIPTQNAGTFHLGGSITYFTKFDQNIKGGATFSVLNTTGFNNTFPSIKTQARGDLGWDIGNVSANVFVNYVGGYRNWSSATVLPLVSAGGIPTSGGDKVAGNATIDLNLAYNFKSGVLDGTQIFLDVTNVFDRDPRFYNSANGYDPYSGNVIGRVTTVGFRAKF
ncbi:TonB-dependent receptor [Sphingomonas sp. BIUV-7]|uniref:TonB-dependent receptor n=1 Tax=Sphingomonas natans TaxID=3063330 RepID=A0ABT8Y7Q2_9SPHN|nr:TonB-dependent receptor [Sphingomonas sp. BIUV-7]MDO6414335.1 TonB-dependent receptor [Sphingomonas sp. BIUV-7]